MIGFFVQFDKSKRHNIWVVKGMLKVECSMINKFRQEKKNI